MTIVPAGGKSYGIYRYIAFPYTWCDVVTMLRLRFKLIPQRELESAWAVIPRWIGSKNVLYLTDMGKPGCELEDIDIGIGIVPNDSTKYAK